jgi:hypothetical protein
MRLAGFYAERTGSDRTENAIREYVGFFAVGVAREEEKFLAAPADHRIGKAGGRTDAPRDFDQDLISNLVPEFVVDFLEVVDINEIKNKLAIAKFQGWIADKRTQHLLHVGPDRLGEKAAVADAGELVGE